MTYSFVCVHYKRVSSSNALMYIIKQLVEQIQP